MGASKRKNAPCQRFMTSKTGVFPVTNMLHAMAQLFLAAADTIRVYERHDTITRITSTTGFL